MLNIFAIFLFILFVSVLGEFWVIVNILPYGTLALWVSIFSFLS